MGVFWKKNYPAVRGFYDNGIVEASTQKGTSREPPPPAALLWVVVKLTVPSFVHNIVRHLIFRVPQKGKP